MTTSEKLGKTTIHGKLESRASEVIAMLLNGGTERAVAEHFGCTSKGVELFKKRHTSELADVRAQAVEIVKQSYLSDKQRRVTELQWWYEQARAEAEQFGVVTEQILMAEDGGPITTRKYRHELAKEARATLKDIAIEEGQIVPAAPNKGGMVREVIIREYEGVPQDWIG